MVVFVSGLNGCSKKEVIKIGYKDNTEQLMLAHLFAKSIEKNTSFKTVLVKYGSSILAFEALEKGKVDVYPEYTGTIESIHLKEEKLDQKDDEQKQKEIEKLLSSKFNVVSLEPLDINNAFRFAITKDVAKEKKIKTLSDLKEVSKEWKLGATTEFVERQDGYNKLLEGYDLQFKGVKSSESSLRYLALEKEEIDIVQAYLTDAYVVMMNLIMLEDDKEIFKEVQPQPLLNKNIAEQYEDVVKALKKLSVHLNTEDVLDLNLLVDEDKEDPAEVAEDYIKKRQIFR